MKNLLAPFTVLFLGIIFISSECERGEGKTAWGSIPCPLERLDWMEVSESYDSEKVIELAATLSAAAEADAKVIKGLENLEANTDFSSELDKEVGKKSVKKVAVSKEFYENYVNQRLSLCALLQALQQEPPVFTSKATRDKAEDAFIDVAKGFSQVKKVEEEKKNP